jgi:ElaB/YqjD/DUF883 family membrane-anchored ribosome-binding protein
MEVRMALGRARAAQDNFDALRSEVDNLRKDFGALVSSLKDNGNGQAELDAIRQRLSSLSDDWQTTGQKQLRKLEDQIGDRPYISLALAFATGLIIGRVSARR